MVFGLFKKKDPMCGMKQEKGKGAIDEKSGNWFCSNKCKEDYYKQSKKKHKGCC